ncbi:MAG: site-specific integrase [Niameybacter sp.]
MNRVEPIRDIDLIKDIGKYLKNKAERNYIMFLIGIYSGLRITDILNLRVRDVKSRNQISMREQKTGKQRIFPINPFLKRALEEYIEDYDLEMEEYLIKRTGKKNKPITRDMAYKIMRDVAEYFGLTNIGTHTLRKTFGYHFYMQTKDIVTLQKIFNHSDPSITLIYIGIEQSKINEKMNKFKLF